jgi:hypothetical protein
VNSKYRGVYQLFPITLGGDGYPLTNNFFYFTICTTDGALTDLNQCMDNTNTGTPVNAGTIHFRFDELVPYDTNPAAYNWYLSASNLP